MKSARFLVLCAVLLSALVACDKGADKIVKGPTSRPTKDAPTFTKANLKSRLNPMQYRVTQENGTEPPFQNEFWDNKEQGIYVDIVSGEPLFSSKDKFKSGTGWPSFTKPLIAKNVVEKSDTTHGMVRVEVRSMNADSHLGHVFDDGPQPTGKRYCINSASMRFIKAKDLEKEGYGQYAEQFGIKITGRRVLVVAAGCFWCTEAIFEAQEGVISVVSGYAGGSKQNPTYEEVCTGKTGHTEAVKITYDSKKTKPETLLALFYRTFDATVPNGVAPDFGDQYRAAIFYSNESEKSLALAAKDAEQAKHKKKVHTDIIKLKKFWPAEDYHQDFVKRNPNHSYVKNVSYKRMAEVGIKTP